MRMFPVQVEAVYHEGIVRLSTNCANEAAKRKVKVYLEISAGNMGSDEKVRFCLIHCSIGSSKMRLIHHDFLKPVSCIADLSPRKRFIILTHLNKVTTFQIL